MLNAGVLTVLITPFLEISTYPIHGVNFEMNFINETTLGNNHSNEMFQVMALAYYNVFKINYTKNLEGNRTLLAN